MDKEAFDRQCNELKTEIALLQLQQLRAPSAYTTAADMDDELNRSAGWRNHYIPLSELLPGASQVSGDSILHIVESL